jgi:primosomal protein N' (replication factor Y)
VAEEVMQRFPDARMAIMSSDTILGPKAARELVSAMAEGDLDILVGTQMVAKGHNFPGLTLVGIVDADLGLAGGDLRAGERTYQVLQQVAGRAGRAERPGRVLLQSYDPDHKVMRALLSGDRDAFLGAEADERAILGMPPFGRLAAVVLSSTEEERVSATARALARAAPKLPDVAVWGPAPAPFALLRGRHRIRFLVKGPADRPLQGLMRDWLARVKPLPGVRVAVDIDPYSFL